MTPSTAAHQIGTLYIDAATTDASPRRSRSVNSSGPPAAPSTPANSTAPASLPYSAGAGSVLAASASSDRRGQQALRGDHREDGPPRASRACRRAPAAEHTAAPSSWATAPADAADSSRCAHHRDAGEAEQRACGAGARSAAPRAAGGPKPPTSTGHQVDDGGGWGWRRSPRARRAEGR